MTTNVAWRSRIGAASALAAGFLLVVGMVGLVAAARPLRPWLAVLFGINAGVGSVSMASLRVVNAIDVAVLALAALTFMGLWPGPSKPHKFWMGLAIALPVAGIGVLLATANAGRSGLMGGGVVLSILMLLHRRWRLAGGLGLLANGILLVGDFTTAGGASPLTATLVGVGYVLLIAWFAWLGVRLFTSEQPIDLVPAG